MDDKEIEQQFTFGVYDSRDKRFMHTDFLKIWPQLQEAFGLETGLQIEVSCVWRSAKAQNDLYQWGRGKGDKGKILTNCDGYNKVSNHQWFPSRAIDVYVCANKKAIWDEVYYNILGVLAENKFKLVWGGSWKGFKDKVHLELPSII